MERGQTPEILRLTPNSVFVSLPLLFNYAPPLFSPFSTIFLNDYIIEKPVVTPEKKKDKLKPKWEGPFVIDQVLTGGAYRLRNASDNRLEPNSWNAARLRRFYA